MEELDYNAITDGDTALPEYSNETHGTSCAGIIAMEKSNNVCAVGVAYESQLIGQSLHYVNCLYVYTTLILLLN